MTSLWCNFSSNIFANSQWCGLRPSILGLDWSETTKFVLVTDAGLVLCCEHCLIMILKDTATFQVLFIVSQVLFIVSIYSLFLNMEHH